jgi:hypothetical protein
MVQDGVELIAACIAWITVELFAVNCQLTLDRELANRPKAASLQAAARELAVC